MIIRHNLLSNQRCISNLDPVHSVLEDLTARGRIATVVVVLSIVQGGLSCVCWLCSLPCASSIAGGAFTLLHWERQLSRGKGKILLKDVSQNPHQI